MDKAIDFIKFFIISIFFLLFNKNLFSINIEKDIFISSYIKGIHLANASAKIRIEENKFYFSLNAKTVGIFSLISSWQQFILSEAILKNHTLKSNKYISQDARGKKKGHMHIKYLENYPRIISAQPDPRKDNRRKINSSLLKNTVDPVIGIFNIGLNGSCNKREIVFDGKRKYALKIKFLQKEKIVKNSFYTNEFDVIKCVFDIEKLEGYTKKEINKFPNNGYIWFKKAKNDFYFPAKIQISTNWGTFLCLIKEKEFTYESNSM